MIKNQSNNLVAEYRYNGLNQRLSWHYDTDADGDCDSSDTTYYFAYDDQWRVVATFRDSDTSPKERFLYHAAGLGGYGGASGGIGGYIDHVIFRDRDINSGWTAASDGTLEERLYYCQNWRADVSAIVTSAGKLVECIKYAAYGTPFALPVGDTDSDGDWDLTDLGNMAGGYEVRKDAELDGDVDASDITYANTNGYQTLGRGVLSSSFVANRKGYAGYENDGAIVRFAHVRNRVLDSTLGRWTRRDPIGYVDGSSLYGYVRSSVLNAADPLGLWANIDFVRHYYFGSGASIDLRDVGLFEAYISHQAIVELRARAKVAADSLARDAAEQLASSRTCICAHPDSIGLETLHGTIPFSVDGSEFIDPRAYRWLALRNFAAFFGRDWTYSIGGHNLTAVYNCFLWASCFGTDGQGFVRFVDYGYVCGIDFRMWDDFEDPTELWGLSHRLIGQRLGVAGWDWLDAAQDYLRRDPLVDALTGQPYRIYTYWHEGTIGGHGRVLKEPQTPCQR